jgi:iron complex outermembrane receptor protein
VALDVGVHVFLPLLPLILVASAPASAQDLPDSAVVVPDARGGKVILPVFEVMGEILRSEGQADVEEITSATIEARDPATVADIVPLVPNARATTNSRGETVLMIRGAPERQIAIQQDGIPLTLPWDERADLSLLPAEAIGEARVTRGAGSVLSGPNAVAGFVQLRTREREFSGWDSRLRFAMGEAERVQGSATVEWMGNAWGGMAVLAGDRSEGFLLPEKYVPQYNQNPDSRLRNNSDYERGNALFKIYRHWKNGSRLALSVQGYDGERGVPPEDYLADARFWRYPEIRRGLTGLVFDWRPDGPWSLDLNLSYDRFHQEIRDYDNADYDSPPLAPGVDYETDDDQTGFGRFELRRRLGSYDTLALAASSRYTLHRESLVYEGPEQEFSEWLSGVGLEWEKRHLGSWGMRLGVGVDHASTPQTGDKPARASQSTPAVSLRGTKEFGEKGELYLQLARRSRFPSLRELYSGALGRFVPNPELTPEDQSSVELGGTISRRRWSLSSALFGYLTEDGIVRKSLPSRQFQRVNEERIRTLGFEVRGSWQPRAGLRLVGHQSFLYARAEEDGSFDAYVEDRPAFISYLDLSQSWRFGGQVGLEAIANGPFYSEDLVVEGLVEVPSQIAWNFRVSYQWYARSTWFSSATAYIRVDNIFDQLLYNQIGLPEAGRMLRAGIDVELGN